MPFGVVWDVFWEPLPLGGLLGHLGGLLAVPGASWSVLDASGERLGASWGPLGGILGASWRPLGASWALPGAILEAIDQKRGWVFVFPSPRRGLQMSILGRSWGHLGALLGALGALLGPSWGPLGALLGHLGAILRPQKPIRSEKARRPKTLISVRFLKDFGVLAFSASRCSKTGQEAPKTAPRRPNRPPREPQDGLIASDDGLRGAHDSSRAPEDGPKEAQEGGRNPKIQTFRPKRPTGGPKRPPRGPQEAPRGPLAARTEAPRGAQRGLGPLIVPLHTRSHWYGCTYPCRTYVSGRSACLPVPQFMFARSVGAYIRAAVTLSKAGVG